MASTASKMFCVKISDDMLTATLALTPDALPGTSVSVDDITAEVNSLKIILQKDAQQAIQKFVEKTKDNQIPQPIVIAQGTAPIHEKDGSIETLFDKKTTPQDSPPKNENAQQAAKNSQANNKPATPENANQSHYERSTIISVGKNAPILHIHPPTKGQDGIDVFGNPIPRRTGAEAKINLGPNVRRQGDQVYADCEGRVNFQNNRVWVDTNLDIPEDVDFSIGNIEFTGDVNVGKNILDCFKVHSRSNILVRGFIEAAEVHAEKSLTCLGGITSKEKGTVHAGEDIISKYITNANVKVGRDVIVQSEIVNCQLDCGGKVIIENGPLVGGHTIATNGIKVKILGSEAGVPTLVDVGIDQSLREKCFRYAEEIDKKRAFIQKGLQAVTPLLAYLKQLNSDQKKNAAKIIQNIRKLEEEINEMTAELRRAVDIPTSDKAPEIEVLGAVFADVTLRFPRLEAKIIEPLKGPVKFTTKTVEEIRRIVAIDNSGYMQTLRLSVSQDEFWETVDRLLNPQQNDL
ncbi:MAG: DUF342 domain-containing protein [Sedimentisphaerales bacterium]|nr:DUF342 domain-containing protein [Sedimentisphaerales bacterium]